MISLLNIVVLGTEFSTCGLEGDTFKTQGLGNKTIVTNCLEPYLREEVLNWTQDSLWVEPQSRVCLLAHGQVHLGILPNGAAKQSATCASRGHSESWLRP